MFVIIVCLIILLLYNNCFIISVLAQQCNPLIHAVSVTVYRGSNSSWANSRSPMLILQLGTLPVSIQQYLQTFTLLGVTEKLVFLIECKWSSWLGVHCTSCLCRNGVKIVQKYWVRLDNIGEFKSRALSKLIAHHSILAVWCRNILFWLYSWDSVQPIEARKQSYTTVHAFLLKRTSFN